VKVVHITELRAAINSARTMAGLPSYTFTAGPVVGSPLRASYITEMRTALKAVYTAMNLPQPVFTDATLTNSTVVKAVHMQQLRDAVH
jgi:hypothetical protein